MSGNLHSPQQMSPEQYSPPTTEHAQFVAVIDRLQEEVTPQIEEDTSACLFLNAELSGLDLQSARIAELNNARDELLAEFLENPREAYIAEVLSYARLCEPRMVSGIDSYGVKKTEFITCNHQTDTADLHFTVLTYPSGEVHIKTEVPLRGEWFENPEPFTISASSTGGFSVEQRVYRQGKMRDVRFDLTPGSIGEDRLRRFFLFSTEAIHLAYTRSPDVQATFDAKARNILKKKHYSGVSSLPTSFQAA